MPVGTPAVLPLDSVPGAYQRRRDDALQLAASRHLNLELAGHRSCLLEISESAFRLERNPSPASGAALAALILHWQEVKPQTAATWLRPVLARLRARGSSALVVDLQEQLYRLYSWDEGGICPSSMAVEAAASALLVGITGTGVKLAWDGRSMIRPLKARELCESGEASALARLVPLDWMDRA